MRAWLASLPPHLSALAHTAPSHRRAVGVLHLNYWAHVVLVTRPFLLWSALRRWQEQQGAADTTTTTTKPSPEKQRHFVALSSACVAAAEQALALMRAMGAAGALSSVVNFDCSCLLEMVQIFRLALVMETPTPADDQGGGGAGGRKKVHAQIVESVEVLRGMENVGWTSQALPELEVQLRECAVFNREEDEALVLGAGQQQQQQAEGSMEVEDTLGAFFGDVLGEGPAGGGAFGDSYNNLLFLEIDFTS